MNQPHKHATVIKAWADGASIQVLTRIGKWSELVAAPAWSTELEYRVTPDPVPEPHKWQKEMDAQDAGKAVQIRAKGSQEWHDAFCRFNFEDQTSEYRVKPEPHKWQKEMDAQAAGKAIQIRSNSTLPWSTTHGDLRFTDLAPVEYRIKPDPERVRMFWWSANTLMGKAPTIQIVNVADHAREPRDKWSGFVGWASVWIDIEHP